MTTLRKLCLIVGCYLLLNQGVISAATFTKDDIAESVDGIMQEKVTEYNIPNAAISIVYLGDSILEKGYGHANISAGTSVHPETTVFRVGSISKLFTATALMQLAEQGKLSLDEDINEYLDFQIPTYAHSQPITLRHLMTHTPGFEDNPESIYRINSDELLPLEEYVREYMPERIFPAGEILAYSNYGMVLAGYIVEQVSGMSFQAYMDENIFTPLQMDHSTFEQPLRDELAPQITTPYRYVAGDFVEGTFEFLPSPAGAMSTSASDMATFMTVFLDKEQSNSRHILDEDTIEQMFEQQFTQHSKLNGMGLGFIEGNFNGQHTLFHGGSTMLYNSAFYLLPDADIGIFIVYSGGNHYLHNEVFQQFLDEFYPEEVVTELESSPGAKDRADQYTGEYHQNRKNVTSSEKALRLTMGIISVQAGSDGRLHITHAGETNKFFEVEPGMYESTRSERTPDAYGNFKRVVFDLDADNHMMLMADGPMTYAKAPWYASSTFTFGVIILILLSIIGTLFSWTFTALIRVLRQSEGPHNRWMKAAKLSAIVHGVLVLSIFLIVIINGDLHPVYQLPKIAYSSPQKWQNLMEYVFYLPVITCVALLFFSVIIWKKGIWRFFCRIHYSLYTLVAFILIWLFYYWNIFV